MNRREILLGAAAVAGASAISLPALAAVRVRGAWEDLDSDKAHAFIFWSAEAYASPHRKVVRDWIKEVVDTGILYCVGDGFIGDRTVRVENLRFDVAWGKPVFNYMTGYTDEIGPSITITEHMPEGRDAVFAPIGLASTHGSKHVRAEYRDVYMVRKPLLRYEEERELRYALGDTNGYSPNSRIGYDMRWMDDFKLKGSV
ncbi:hypothetical protein HOU00_gp305 [Caulobacter phage CcrPW]|uniref:TAT signal protein n=1 Tax=Caulobacter phage CcrPW TaxID=2283271 RepID=A0A385EAY1_9CAUD|nr:hypothetical protein HOU00_gp305 [Caulobacter phage CcrPW]AXQ68820.1 hypothetical protein CcrPW_gp281 [Caulobacter phage CcrPW]